MKKLTVEAEPVRVESLDTGTINLVPVAVAPDEFRVHISEGTFYEAEWTNVHLFVEDQVVSSLTIYGWFRKSRAKRAAKRMVRDAKLGIYWSN